MYQRETPASLHLSTRRDRVSLTVYIYAMYPQGSLSPPHKLGNLVHLSIVDFVEDVSFWTNQVFSLGAQEQKMVVGWHATGRREEEMFATPRVSRIGGETKH